MPQTITTQIDYYVGDQTTVPSWRLIKASLAVKVLEADNLITAKQAKEIRGKMVAREL